MRCALLALTFAVYPLCVAAQSVPRPGSQSAWEIGLRVGQTNPQADFRRNIGAHAWLVDVDALYRLPRTPVYIGLAFGGGDYGHQKRRVSLAALIPESPLEFDVDTTNSILFGSVVVRLQPRYGRLRPYVEGVWGFSELVTATTVSDPSRSGICWADLLRDGRGSSCPSSDTSRTTNLDHYVRSAGIGLGTQVDVRQWARRDNPARELRLSLDARVQWRRGGIAEYLKPGSIGPETGDASLHAMTSRTDVKTVQIGIAVHF